MPIPGDMNPLACRAVAQAGLVAVTASADDEQSWPLLLVAGWLTTASDLVLSDARLAEDLAALPV
ncbi:hypothetical protein SAMN05660657_04340 [Geodermatophilus amargosae]|uniref:Uncharacterized protein n=2 Tax=Geodermatophilus amargosae TaxID=1296565 RepID=A0A1I7CD17_9ACTN|nr:hypothetical protein SAMN05660657_04340 [Geodermatophilus amargosae]